MKKTQDRTYEELGVKVFNNVLYHIRYRKCIAIILLLSMITQYFVLSDVIPFNINKAQASSVDNQKPDAPSNLNVVSVSGPAISFKWDVSNDNIGIRKYEIYSNGTLIGSTGGTSYTYTGLKEGTAYSFYVIAYDYSLNVSDSSNIVTITTESQAPDKPNNLNVVSVSGPAITLEWGAASDIFGIRKYEIYSNGALIGSTGGTSYTYRGLKEGTSYSFHAIAYDYALNASEPSNTVTIATESQSPDAPSNLEIVLVSEKLITLSWEAASDIFGVRKYEIYSNGVLIGSTGGTSYTYRGLKEGTAYSFYVIAYDYALNASESSNTVSLTTESQAPEAPRNLNVASVSGPAITLDWEAGDDVFGIRKYEIYSNGVLIGSTGGTSYTYTGLKEGTAYSFYVIAYDYALNASEPSNIVTIETVLQVPQAPRNLKVISVSGPAITLEWEAGSDVFGIRKYEIYSNGTLIGSTGGTNYTYTGLKEGTAYSFHVIAYDYAMNASEPSNIVTIETVIQVPQAPRNLKVISVSGPAITLEWEAGSDVFGIRKYEIYSNGTLIGSTGGTNYTYTGLKEGTAYSFHVIAYDYALNTSEPSNTVSITSESQAPEAARNLKVVSVSGLAITLEWEAGSDVFGIRKYEIYSNGTLIGSTGGTSYTYKGLTEGTAYSFYVIAYDYALNPSDPSNTVYFIFDNLAPKAPSNLRISSMSGNTLTLEWDASDDNVGTKIYEIYCNGNVIDSTESLSYIYTQLIEGEVYVFDIIAIDFSGNKSDASNIVQHTMGYSLSLKTTGIDNTHIGIEWSLTREIEGITNYQIIRNGITIGNIDATSYLQWSEWNLIPETEYTYSVQAYDSQNKMVAVSNYISIITNSSIESSFSESVALRSMSGTMATFTWNTDLENFNAVDYDAYLGGSILLESTIGAESNTIIVNCMYPCNSLPIIIMAKDLWGNLKQLDYALYVNTEVETPTNISAIAGDEGIEISWEESAVFPNYIYFEVSVNGEIFAFNDYYNSGNTFIHTNVIPNHINEYKVRTIWYDSWNESWEERHFSEWSDICIYYSGIVDNLAVKTISDNNVIVSWDKTIGATAYEVEINGITMGTVTDLYYNYNGTFNTINTYKVRPILDNMTGIWRTYAIWEKAENPYLINEDININQWMTLVLKPGTILTFTEDSGININGDFIAEGTDIEPIILNGYKNGDYWYQWDGIQILGKGKMKGDHIILEDLLGRFYNDHWAFIYIQDMGSLYINNSNIKLSNSYNGACFSISSGNDVTIQNTRIEDIKENVVYVHKKDTDSGNIIIINNNLACYQHYCYIGIRVTNPGIGDVIIENNDIINTSYGIKIESVGTGVLSIKNNRFIEEYTPYNYFQYSIYINISGLHSPFNFVSDNYYINRNNGIYVEGEISYDTVILPHEIDDYYFGNIIVPDGVCLTVCENNTMKFDKNCSMTVYGELIIDGREDNPVVFKSINETKYGKNKNTYWAGINIMGYMQANYLMLRYANNNNISVYGNISLYNSDISYAYNCGIYFHNDVYEMSILEYNTFHDNQYAIMNESIITINAKNNYWNSPYGPCINTYDSYSNWYEWVGDGEKIGPNIEYMPYLGMEMSIGVHFNHTRGTYAPTGNYSYQNTDLSVKCLSEDFELNRSYNSQNADKMSIFGRGWSFNYEAAISISDYNDKIINAKLPDGSHDSYLIQEDGTYIATFSRNKLVRNPDGSYIITTKHMEKYYYNNAGILYAIDSKEGNRISINLNPSGKPSTITDFAGRQYQISYVNGLISNITDPEGRLITYIYEQNRLVKVIDATSQETHYVYYSNGVLSEVRDHNNNTIEKVSYMAANGLLKVASLSDIYGNIKTYTYETGSTTITDSNGRTTKQWYDNTFNTTLIQDTEGKTTQIRYNRYENVNKYNDIYSYTDRYGNNTYYYYDMSGNITEQTNPDGSYKTFTYDDKNNVTSSCDENSNYIYYIYDEDGRLLLKEVKPLNGTDAYTGEVDQDKFAITTYNYYQYGENGYSIHGLIKSIIYPNGNTITYTYDAHGNIATTQDGEGHITRNTYDNVGQVLSILTPKGELTKYNYDSKGQIIKIEQNQGETTEYRYDILGNIIQEISPNLYYPNSPNDIGQRYTYYSNGLVHTTTDPENNATTYTYDIYGNLLTEQKANGCIYAYSYDVMNRITAEFVQENRDNSMMLLKEYEYQNGHDNSYNNISIVIEKVHLNDTDTAVTIKSYNYADMLVMQVNPDNGILHTEYNYNGTVNFMTDAMNHSVFYSYDGLNRLTDMWKSFEEGLYSYKHYSYDKNSNITQEKTGIELVALFAYPLSFNITTNEYDGNNRLISTINIANGRSEYDYDGNGNRVKETAYMNNEDKRITEYTYNHLGKVSSIIQHCKACDLSGYVKDDLSAMQLLTTYEYDKNGNILLVNDPDNTITTYIYDNLDRLISQSTQGIDEYGASNFITQSYTYDYAGNILTSSDALGNITYNTYNHKGELKRTINSDGGITAFSYDNAGRLVTKINPLNYIERSSTDTMSRTAFIYDIMNRVILEQDIYYDKALQAFKTINSKAYKYDLNGNIIKQLDALGYSSGNGTSIEEKIDTGYGTLYTYNYANLPTTIKSPVSQERGIEFDVRYTYDGAGRRISETDANNSIKKYYYGGADRIIKASIIDTTERILQQNTYDRLGNVLTTTDGNGNITYNLYNSLGLLKRQLTQGDTSIPGYAIDYQYDRRGRLSYQTDNVGKEITYVYNNLNQILSQTEGRIDGTESITISNAYDKNGNLRFATDANGAITENIYDSMNRLIETKIAVNDVLHSTKFTYDKNSNMISTADWLGNIYMNEYDALNRIIKKTDPYNKTIQTYEYNDNHIQVMSNDAGNNSITYGYDRNNRLISTTDASGHITKNTYDSNGNILTKTDGMDNVTTYQYDALNRLIKVTNAKGEETSYTYDMIGNILTKEDGEGNITTYTYNSANLILMKEDSGSGSDESKRERYTYYSDGGIRTKKDRNGNTAYYEYDIHGRLLSETIGSDVISYTYDNKGNLLTSSNNTGTTVRTYDELDRVLSKNVTNVGTINYIYDITNNVEAGCYIERSIDPKGNITDKTYDRVGRLQKVTVNNNITRYQYYDNGNLECVIYDNDFKEEYTYYNNNQIHTLINRKTDGSIMDQYSYTYDNAGNQLSKTEIINDIVKGTTSYTYDSLNRLLTVTEPNGRITTYEYDMAGNRATEIILDNDISTENIYNCNEQNRLTNITTKVDNSIVEVINYTYDNNGNQLSTTNETYKDGLSTSSQTTAINTYDLRNQLITTITADDTSIVNSYNAEGYRVAKEVGNEITYYLYEYDKIILELDNEGNQKARNIYGTNLLLRTVDDETFCYMYNGHADVIALITEEGAIAASYYYDAFGNILEATNGVDNNILYSGYQYDRETGLYYLNARMYDPKIARFLQEDTYTGELNDPLNLNLYTYCANNPIVYIDPTGHFYYTKDGQVSSLSSSQQNNNNQSSKQDVFTYTFGKETLKKGERENADVKAMQKMLLELGYDLGDYGADGNFGKVTLKAVKSFQRKNGLKDDGRVGPATKAALLNGKKSADEIEDKSIENELPSNTSSDSDYTPDPVVYRQIIDSFDVENNEKYLKTTDDKGNPITFCNYYVKDVMNELGATIPEYVSKETGEALTEEEIRNEEYFGTRANRISIWLKDYGEENGWYQVTAEEAQANANQGVPTIATWYNNRKKDKTLDAIPWNHDGNTGHVAIVVPYNPTNKKEKSNEGVYISQAGTSNYSYKKIESGFNEEKIGQTEYFRYYSYKGVK